MSLIVFPVFRSPVPAVKPCTSGESLAVEFAALDRIAMTSGVTPLTAFADQRSMLEGFDGPPWELDEVLGPGGDWFQASDGLAAVTELARLIRARLELACDLESPQNVADELDDLARVLAVAAAAGAEFRLEIQ